jgi:hypothetical protein
VPSIRFILSTPSLGITLFLEWVEGHLDNVAFNSLSRDHFFDKKLYPWTPEAATFNSLSRDHGRRAERIALCGKLSTPSLGITLDECEQRVETVLNAFQLPLSGSQRAAEFTFPTKIENLSTPSLGITRDHRRRWPSG